VSGVSERWDGAARPGHFDGVATVVAKLFAAVQPALAIFGEKDFQQLAVIRRMNSDLGLRVEVVGMKTVRDADGLALSSRNAYLNGDERLSAVALPRALEEAREAILAGTPVAQVLAAAKARLAEAGFGLIDYVALVDASTLEPLDAPGSEMRLIAAARIGTTRLIDNIQVVQAAKEKLR
jgi:pantoate--beta-alanine ligase